MELIKKYFPDLSAEKLSLIEQYADLMKEWNTRINLISRQDMENFEERHLLHSLAIAKQYHFAEGTKILDLGTGGGLPGIPLAIVFPECAFTLIDARGKKITAVQAMTEELGLANVESRHRRAEEVMEKFDFVVSRAVSGLNQVWTWAMPRIHLRHRNATPNGLIIFKGGKLKEEISALPKKCYSEIQPVSEFFSEPYFEEKYLVYLQR